MDKRDKTVAVYNEKAKAFGSDFDDLVEMSRPNVEKIFEVLEMPKDDVRVLELGCGNGRDAGLMLNYTSHYLGVDASEAFIELARQRLPGTRFEVGDMREFVYEEELDCLVAFASLLHLNRDELRSLFSKVYKSLSMKGVVAMTLKEGDYSEVESADGRIFYLYREEDVLEIAGELYERVYSRHFMLNDVPWFFIILGKHE